MAPHPAIVRLAGAALLAGAAIGPVPLALAAPKGAVHVVIIAAMQYAPATLRVRAGDTVVWRNQDPFPHTVTAADKSFDSGAIPAGGSWKTVVARRGDFAYLCTLHRTMKAALEVR